MRPVLIVFPPVVFHHHPRLRQRPQLLPVQTLIAKPPVAHSKVPAWFDEENGYAEDEHPGELYDLRADLAQKHNLYAAAPAKLKELTALLESIRAKGQVR